MRARKRGQIGVAPFSRENFAKDLIVIQVIADGFPNPVEQVGVGGGYSLAKVKERAKVFKRGPSAERFGSAPLDQGIGVAQRGDGESFERGLWPASGRLRVGT